MKRILLIIIFLTTIFSIGSLRAQDTVTKHDPWYLYNTITSCEEAPRFTYYGRNCRNENRTSLYYYDAWDGWRGDVQQSSESYDWFHVQRHFRQHGEYVYGIAVTALNMPLGEEWYPAAPIMGLYNAGQSSYITSSAQDISVRLVDSLTIMHQRQDCVFKYELTGLTPVENVYSPCHEFYFQHPYPIDSLTDSFYVALAWPHERRNLYREMITSWPDSEAFLPVYIFDRWGHCADPEVSSVEYLWKFYFNTDFDAMFTSWYRYTSDSIVFVRNQGVNQAFGIIFPIIHLRCTAPWVHLADRRADSATVSWDVSEPGMLYQTTVVPYGQQPDAGAWVSTVDTFHTFTGLDPQEKYCVWVRKVCHYATSEYDTLVYSDWSPTVGFSVEGAGTGTEGISSADGDSFSLTPNPARSSVLVALPASAVGGRLSLCDLAGRELEAHTVQGPSLELDVSTRAAGVYLVKLVTPRGVSSRRLVVE